MIKEFAQLNELLYNHCIGTDFKKKKFARIINPEEDKLNIWNAFCILSGAWRCNDAVSTIFHFDGTGVDSSCWVYLFLDL